MKTTEERIKDSRYFFGDISQIIFKAQEKIKNGGEKPKDNQEIETIKKHEIEILTEKLNQLRKQNEELNSKLAESSTSEAEKRM